MSHFRSTSWLRLLLSVSVFLQLAQSSAQYGPLMAPLAHQPRQSSLFSFNSTWQVLGPFQIGTREATWGADPLEYVGGFRHLSYDSAATFRSSLPTNGSATWNITQAVQVSTSANSANASLSVSYSNVNWDFLKTVYGWAAVQYQAWARGELIVGGNETQHVILHTDAILEYWVDDVHYFGGDFYTFRKAPPVLHLEPGTHRIDLRLVRDVRAFGGILEPTIDVVVDVRQASGTLELVKPGLLLSDVVDGKLASPFASAFLRNSGQEDIEIVDIRPSNDTHSSLEKDLSRIVLAAGQTRPVTLHIVLPSQNASSIVYNITYRSISNTAQSTLQVSQDLTHRSMYDPHKITFVHPGGMVSYTMFRPPAKNATCHNSHSKAPVLLALHGAGLEADNGMVTAALDPVSDLCAFVLFPTGVTPWSGDDWHNWGFTDVQTAISAIPGWIQIVDWKGPQVDIDRWIVSGHSNGGQGTWYALTHRPDKIIAAAPVSGYASIQKYVPYELWQPADPRRIAVVSGSINSYRHEMLMANAKGIIIQQQHGEIDDNVPAYNSRLLAQQLQLAGANSSYNELPDKNHYYDGIMTTPVLTDFYYSQARNDAVLPRKLEQFTIVVADPGDMGSKGGIRVLQLHDPGQYGKVKVKGRVIRTSNVASLEFDPTIWDMPVAVDGQEIDLVNQPTEPDTWFTVRNVDSSWTASAIDKETAIGQRRGRQLGSMTAILRTQGPFIIQHAGSTNTTTLALQISRNLHQYFQADASIHSSFSDPAIMNATGNIITLAVSATDIEPLSDFPISIRTAGLSVTDHRNRVQEYGDAVRGAAFLRPAGGDRLELVIWGVDDEGLRQAARIVPMLTGVGQPDFIVFGESAKWRGIEGALAMGFFDSDWKVTASSVVELE
ncbi:hypothetical protein FB567DRAFT_590365 [Paraphoma chrysanthemicola]|uniref:Peptidase S9 prolyl oligopeptidase catalytic domain-containing protein n=1 Tax=Paraphoma chrysanthemicola TaxID=798071 RepID=A0A8K0W059_9PLEO|nr:hypothetical protein FB567DRAFT_590365 [Paraphoma chrysanthemicola]